MTDKHIGIALCVLCIMAFGTLMFAAIYDSNAKEIERNTCVPSIIKVDAIEAFTCKAKGKVSQQTIDDVKYNVCTAKNKYGKKN